MRILYRPTEITNPNILLINAPDRDYQLNPQTQQDKSYYAGHPLGLVSIASTSLQNGEFKVAFLDAERHGLSFDEISTQVRSAYPNSVEKIKLGLNVQTPNFQVVMALCDLLKRDFGTEKLQLIFGGSQATLYPESILERHPDSTVIVGDGETAVLQLLRGVDQFQIPGLRYMNGGSVIDTGVAMENLDQLPMLDRKFIDVYIKRGLKTWSIYASKGCYLKCGFCTQPALNEVYGNPYRQRSFKNVAQEVDVLLNQYPEIQQLEFYDSDLFPNKKRVNEFLNAWKEYKLTGRLEIIGLLTPNKVAEFHDAGLLKDLKANGIAKLNFGVEAGYPEGRVLASGLNNGKISRKYSINDQMSATLACHETGIESKAYFMIGFMNESEWQTRQTLAWAYALGYLGLRGISIFPYKIYPGTNDFKKFVGDAIPISQLMEYTSDTNIIANPEAARLRSLGTLIPGYDVHSEIKPLDLNLLADHHMAMFEQINNLSSDDERRRTCLDEMHKLLNGKENETDFYSIFSQYL